MGDALAKLSVSLKMLKNRSFVSAHGWPGVSHLNLKRVIFSLINRAIFGPKIFSKDTAFKINIFFNGETERRTKNFFSPSLRLSVKKNIEI